MMMMKVMMKGHSLSKKISVW